MPIIKSAIKKMRKDKVRTAHNKEVKDKLKSLIKAMRREPGAKIFSELTSSLDKAVKINFIHTNKSARLKSRLSRLVISAKPASKKSSKLNTSVSA